MLCVLEHGTFTRWGEAEGLLGGRVYCMAQDQRGALWFGTFKGLSRWSNGKWTYWRTPTLGMERVFTITVDHNDRVWFGHNYLGVGFVDEHDSVHYVTSRDGLVNDRVWGLATDDHNGVWVATENGLGYILGDQLLGFDVHSGLPNPVLWPVVPYHSRVYIGTQGSGVAVLDRWIDKLPPPRILIDEPNVLARTVVLRWKADAYWGTLNAAQIQTRFRVNNNPWSLWSTERQVRLSNLSYGDYTIDIQSRGPFGEVDTNPTSKDFEILAPYYFRAAFYVPVGILLLMLAGVTANYLHRKRRFEDALRENEQRFRAQYQSNPIPTFTWRRKDGEFILADCNEVARQIQNGLFTSWLGLPMTQVVGDMPHFVEVAEKCYREQTSIRSEFSYALPSSDTRAIMDTSMTFVPPDMLLVHTRNVTQEKVAAAEIQRSREELRALAARLESVREEERKDLSREIHDELGQAMTGLKMDLAWIRRRLAGGTKQCSGAGRRTAHPDGEPSR